MSHEVKWTKIVMERFIEQGLLTDEDEEILRLHIAGFSRVKIADTRCCSTSTVDRAIKRLKLKYDEVQKYDPVLPPRHKYHDMLKK